MRPFARICVLSFLPVSISLGCALGAMQGVSLPYEETFDTTIPPALPPGWRSSTQRTPGVPDFTCVTSSPSSVPNAVLASNATVEQWLDTPLIDCSSGKPDRIRFLVRRSSTFAARCVVEASVDGGTTFVHVVGDAPALGSGSSYVQADLPLPLALEGCREVVVRFHILPDAAGTTGTFRIDDVRITVALPEVPAGAVVVNEIQYQPASNEPEWIELYNTGPQAVDLKGWTLSDASESTSHRLTNHTSVLEAEGYTVVVADSSSFRAFFPAEHIKIFQPDGFPSLNNTGDRVLLRDHYGRCMDSVWYRQEWGGGAGITLERIDPLRPALDGRLWGSCLESSRGTPGRINSIVIRENDLRAGTVSVVSAALPESALLRLVVYNPGRQPSGNFSVRLYCAPGSDSVVSDARVVASALVTWMISPGDSLAVDLVWSQPRPGNTLILAEIVWPGDQRPENNRRVSAIMLPIPRGMIRVNEIMASPIGGTAEYVELINCGTAEVDLSGCWISDRPLLSGSVNRWPVTVSSHRLRPGEFHVVAGDSTVLRWPGCNPQQCSVVNRTGLGLNNEGDCVVVYAPDGSMVDSVAYLVSWHSANVPDPAGRSMERYHPHLSGNDPNNWGTSVHGSGGTPGQVNSIAVAVLPGDASLSCMPDPFSPDADGRDDVTVIRYRLPLRSALVRIKVFDLRGRCVRDLINTAPAGAAGEVVWDGYDNNRQPLRTGIYILYVEAIDGQGGNIVTAKKAVVLARRL